jgi:Plavaka transposase
MAYATPSKTIPSWAPLSIEYWQRDSLEVLKDIVGDVRLASEMKWAPEKLYNTQGVRLYFELWTGDWWWENRYNSELTQTDSI